MQSPEGGPSRPPYPWEASRPAESPKPSVAASPSAYDSPNSPDGPESQPDGVMGFYKVVRNGLHFYGLTNGTKLSGQVSIPIEVGYENTDSLTGAEVSNGTTNDPISGLTVSYFGGLPSADWNTILTTNGTYQIQPGIHIGDSAGSFQVTGTPISVTVTNPIWFPEPFNVAGDYLLVQAQSIHANGTYQIDIYEDAWRGGTNLFLQVEGAIDSAGFITYQGFRGFIVNLTDINGNPLPSNWYDVDVTTFAAGTPVPHPAGSGTKVTNTVPVERFWPTNQNFLTKFTIGYMPVYGNPRLGASPAVQLEGMIQNVYGPAQLRNGLGVAPGHDQDPFELWGQTNFTTWLITYLRQDEIRNLYYFGHGATDYFGTKDPHGSDRPGPGQIRISDLNFVLGNNFKDPLSGGSKHSFRFAFLDGCNTANGDLCKAFGIPKIKKMTTNDFYNRGMRARAFVGWDKYHTVGLAHQAVNTTHTMLITNFFAAWSGASGAYPVGHPRYNMARTLRDAITWAAQSGSWTGTYNPEYRHLILYGYEDLLWQDTVP